MPALRAPPGPWRRLNVQVDSRKCGRSWHTAIRSKHLRSAYRTVPSGVEVDRRLGCRAIVVVMESANLRRRDDTPRRRRPDGARDRRVLLECEMRSGPHAVRDVIGEHPLQPRRAHNDDMIEALTSDGPDDALDVGVLQSCRLRLITRLRRESFVSPIRSIR